MQPSRTALRVPSPEPVAARTLALSVVSLLLVTLAGAPGCAEKEVPDEAPVDPVVLSIKTLMIGGADGEETREYPGQLAAWQNAEMAFEVDGKIVDWRFREGEAVSKGTILARLDPRDFEAGVKAAEANLARAKADFLRYEKLHAEGVAAESELDARRQRYGVRQAEFRVAKKRLEDADLTAPFDGTVARKLVQDFENVIAKIPVLVLQDVSKLKIKVTVPEADMTGDGRGTQVDIDEINRILRPEVVVTSLRDQSFPALLHELALTADPVTRTFEATFVMENPKGFNLLPGMTAKAVTHVAVDRGMGLTIPALAVVADAEGNGFVWRIDSTTRTVSRASVEVGGLTGDRIEIRSGLDGGDEIAISGVHSLADGQQVRVLDARMR